MRTYRPSTVPDNPAELPGFLRREFPSIEQAAARAEPFALLQVLHDYPPRVFAGMVCYFDGTDCDPGSGEGLYRRDKANAAWVFIG